MTNLLDYIAWRGDIDFAYDGINEVDALVFSQLAYIDFSFVSTGAKSLCATANFLKTKTQDEVQKLFPPYVNAKTKDLFFALAASKRFGAVQIAHYVAHTDSVLEKQFAGVTFLHKKFAFVAYRGTDNTLVGWKEDFNMAFMSPVPAQKEAVLYLQNVAKLVRGKIFVAGHSKGGNLAMYASALCGAKVQRRIQAIYNNDGPGFESSFLKSKDFERIQAKVHTFMPKSSIVGTLFEHAGETYIQSNETGGMLQHDPFSWSVVATHFERFSHLTADSVFIDLTLKEWLSKVDKKSRELCIDTVFRLLSATGAVHFDDLSENRLKNSYSILKEIASLDVETRDATLKTIQLLFRSARKTVPTLADLLEKARTQKT